MDQERNWMVNLWRGGWLIRNRIGFDSTSRNLESKIPKSVSRFVKTTVFRSAGDPPRSLVSSRNVDPKSTQLNSPITDFWMWGGNSYNSNLTRNAKPRNVELRTTPAREFASWICESRRKWEGLHHSDCYNEENMINADIQNRKYQCTIITAFKFIPVIQKHGAVPCLVYICSIDSEKKNTKSHCYATFPTHSKMNNARTWRIPCLTPSRNAYTNFKGHFEIYSLRKLHLPNNQPHFFVTSCATLVDWERKNFHMSIAWAKLLKDIFCPPPKDINYTMNTTFP